MSNQFVPKVVLSKDNRRACIEKLKCYQFPWTSNSENISKAAVLIPLCLYKGEVGLVYTLRSMKLRSNRGQVSFPGGMQDKCDANLQETALRETWEELKIPKEKIDVWTTGNLIFKQDVHVLPVLAYIGEIEPEQLEINHDEVEEAFVVTLEKLCDPKLHGYTRFQRFSFNLPTYLGGKHRIWGFTGFITHIILECLLPNIYEHKFEQVLPLRRNISDETKLTKTSIKQPITQSKI